MPLSVMFGPNNFYWQKPADPKTLVSIPLTLNVFGAAGDHQQNISMAGINALGYVFTQDFSQLSGVQRLTQIKSLNFVVELATSLGGLPELFIFVPDSGQLYHFIGQEIDSAGSYGFIINAALPIITNGTTLTFVFAGISAAEQSVSFVARINNFDVAPFVDRSDAGNPATSNTVKIDPTQIPLPVSIQTSITALDVNILGQPIDVTTVP